MVSEGRGVNRARRSLAPQASQDRRLPLWRTRGGDRKSGARCERHLQRGQAHRMMPRSSRTGLFAFLAMVLTVAAPGLTAPAADAPPSGRQPNSTSDSPLNRDGEHQQILTDEELWRRLLALSTTNEAATALIVRCHAAGTPYGHPAWRACVQAR
ncbi:MAG: hypothetical protein JWQ72_2281 [Polaromonas sp.]|nr:hypothetical protein [Polaromonas sp.]